MKTSTPLKLIIPVFMIAICGYLATLNPALFRNDSPETITGCVTLCVTHPPGYPLFNLMGKCFNVFAVGNPAFTYNFIASLLASVGASLLCINLWVLLSNMELLRSPLNTFPPVKYIACFTAALSFAFSNGYWGNAIAAKGGIYVFQITLELSLLLFFQTAVFKEKIGLFEFYFLMFLFFVGCLNHWPSQVLLIPAFFLFFIFQIRHFPKLTPHASLKITATCLTLLFTTLSVYLYLPLRAHLYPVLNFDAPYTWDRLKRSIFRGDYTKTEIMSSRSAMFLHELSQKSIYISQHLFSEFYIFAYFFMLIGVFPLNKTNKKLTLFFLFLLLTIILTNLFYLQVTPIEFWHMDDHLLSSNWILGMLMGIGIHTFFNLLASFKRPNIKKILQTTSLILFLSFIPLTFAQNFSTNNQKDEFLYYGYGVTALKSLPKNSLYFAESDYDCFSTLYLKTVLNKRPDVHLLLSLFIDKPYERTLILKTDPTLLNRTPNETKNSVLFDLIKNNYKSHPIYCTFANVGFADLYLKNFKEMRLVPSGILTQVIQPKESITSGYLHETLKSFWDEYLEIECENPSPNQGLLRQACASPFLNAALYEKLHGNLTNWDWYYSKAVNLISEPSWLAQTWFARAEGNALFGNKLVAEKCYQIAAYYFAQLGQLQNAQVALEKAKILSLTS